MGRLGYRPALDGLRGVAIALVVLFHFDKLPGGWVGVDVFFVLSGFLITTLLLEEHARTGAISLRRFYSRRAWRLMPALWLLLAVHVTLVLTGYVEMVNPFVSARTQLAWSACGFFYVTNFLAASGTEPAGLTPLWSLAQEEQFYVLWPPLLLLLIGRVRTRTLCIGLGIAAAVVIARRFELVATGSGYDRVYYAPDSHFDPIIVGCLLAFGLRRPLLRARLAASWPLAVVVLAALTEAPHLGFDYMWMILPATAATCVLISASLEATLLRRLLELRPLIVLGIGSYTIYLWHQYLISNVWLPLTIAILPLVVLLAYTGVERRFRRGRDTAGSPELRLLTAVRRA